MWDPPGPGIKAVLPALAGRFLTTEQPKKPHLFIYVLEVSQVYLVRALQVDFSVLSTHPHDSVEKKIHNMKVGNYNLFASKFGKLSSGHRTEKGQFSFQSQRKAMPKIAQTTTQLHPSHTLVKVMLKILQARLQQYVNHELPDVQAGIEKAEEPEIKLPTSAGSWKKQESSRKTSISALLTMPKPLTV